MSHQTPNRIAILGGDPSISRALALLLRGYGYDSFPIEVPVTDSPERLLDEVRLLLFLATSNTDCAEDFLEYMDGAPETASIPIIELSSILNGPQVSGAGIVPWPCRTETLVGEIEAMLSATAHDTSVRRQGLCKPAHPCL